MESRNVTYMIYGLVAAWLIVLGYVVLLALRERKLRKELDRGRRVVEGGKHS
jgi:CcmD family protein